MVILTFQIKRGTHKKRGFNDIVHQNVHNVIERLPKCEVHYLSEAKSTSVDVYLEPDCTLKDAYQLFKDENIETEALGDKKQPSLGWFYDGIKRRFSQLKVKPPTKEACNTCATLKLQQKYDDLATRTHRTEAKLLLGQETIDFEYENCITFDLMQVQPLPYLNVGKAFLLS